MIRIIKKSSIIVLLLLLYSNNNLAPPAVASDDFVQACQLYASKDYGKARPIFEETVKKYPAFWQGHYYLGHTYLALGQRLAAKKEYAACLASKPAPAVDAFQTCEKMIESLGGRTDLPASSAGKAVANEADKDGGLAEPAIKADKSEKTVKEGAEAGLSPQEKDRQWRKKSIQDICDREVALLKEEVKERIAQAERDTNNWGRMSPGEYLQTHLPDQERASITREYEDKIQNLKDKATQQIEAIK